MFKEKFVKMSPPPHLGPSGPPSGPAGSSWMDKFKSGAGQTANVADALATGATASAETQAFLDGMRTIAAESNYIQMEMAKLELSKKLAEGFAKFIKEMGKAFTQIGQ